MALPKLGVLSLRVNGEALRIDAEWTYSLGGEVITELVAGASGVLGAKGAHLVPYIEGTLRDSADFDVASLRSFYGGTATLHLRSGKTIAFRGATVVGASEVEGAEGKIALRIEAVEAEEV